MVLLILGKVSPAFMLVSCLAYSSTLKMEAICSSDTSVDFQQFTRRYIPEDSTLYTHVACIGFVTPENSIHNVRVGFLDRSVDYRGNTQHSSGRQVNELFFIRS
jgi:hypothetical protein